MAARRGRQNTVVTYNGQALTNYTNSAEVSSTLDRIETTHFGSTANESIAGDAEWRINIGGDWDNVVDGYLAPDAITPGTRRTASAALTGSSQTVTYTWTTNAEIGEWSISSNVNGKIEWSAVLILSGAPTRTAA